MESFSTIAPSRNIAQLINPYTKVSLRITKEIDTNLDVKLLIMPVVVSYCLASANTAAIPERWS
jgi:hypothetical protein